MALKTLNTTLRENIQKNNGKLILGDELLGSQEITKLLTLLPEQASLPELKFVIEGSGTAPLNVSDSDTSVVVSGRASLYQLTQVEVSAKFYLLGERPQLILTVSLPPDWLFSRSFPGLVNSLFETSPFSRASFLFDDLKLKNASLILDSVGKEGGSPEGWSQGLNFQAQLDVAASAALAGAKPFLGSGSLTLAGTIQQNSEVPLVQLSAPVSGGISLDYFSDLPAQLHAICRRVEAELPGTSSYYESYLEVATEVKLGQDAQSTSIPLRVRFGYQSSSFVFEADLHQVPIDGPTALQAFVPNADFDSIVPNELQSKSGLYFSTLCLTVNSLNKLTSASIWVSQVQPWSVFGLFTVAAVHVNFAISNPGDAQSRVMIFTAIAELAEWKIVEHVLELKNISVQLQVSRSPSENNQSQTSVTGILSGTASLADKVDLTTTLFLPIGTGNWTLASDTPVELTTLNDLARLVGGRDMSALLPGGVGKIGGFTLEFARLVIDPTHWTLAHFAFALSSTGEWPIIENQLALKYIRLAIDLSNPLKTSEVVGSIGGAIAATITIATVDIILAATYPAVPLAGWQFEGSTGVGEVIPAGKLFEDLGTKLGKFDPPEALKELDVENLKISFNTQSKDFSFSGKVKFPVDGQELDMVLTIDIKHQQDDSYTKQFSGKITIDAIEFDVIFDSKNDSTTFIAAYNDPDGHAIKVQDLVNRVSTDIGGNVPSSLKFTIKDALLAYQNRGSPAEKNYLFGIDIDGGLNLSDLRLPDLPLIGPPFPPDQTLKLSFQLLAAKGTFSPNDVSALNDLLVSGPKLPDKEIKEGLDLSTVLQIGQETRALALPIGFDNNTGLVETSSGSSSSAANVTGNDGTQWIVLQKSFGPVHLERIGLKFERDKGEIQGLLDAALTAGGLTISLNGLSVTSPLTKLEPTFDLHGLGIDYRNGSLEIGGAFLKQTITPANGAPYTTFSGQAVIRNENLTISAIGSYTNYQNHPSLFIYAVLDYPIGGPSFFFVTGLAAGFGYNRTLNVPAIDKLKTFPLIEEATREGGPPKLPADQQGQQQTLTDELAKLETFIPPAVGENFLAVGIHFTSFKIIDSFALLTVKFGGRLEFDLLGLSTLKSPPPVEGKTVTPVAEAQLALKATYIPDDGFLGVQAQLTPNSYILSKACHLTGGFAFYSWFKDIKDESGKVIINGGDFVLTLGGYHPKYNPPAHYPRVPRLGINWQVNDQLSIKGDAYFALTSHALMAGGHLEALWQESGLRAWFNVGADFLINWQPYHYDITAYVEIGASYTFDIFGTRTITVDLGVDLHLWGPEFSGSAVLNILCFSIPIKFGAQSSTTLKPISWDAFKSSFLPADDQICSIAVQGGLIRQIEKDGQQKWIINPKEFRLATHSVIPSNGASMSAHLVDVATLFWNQDDTHMRTSPVPFRSAITEEDVREFLIASGFHLENEDGITEVPEMSEMIATLELDSIKKLLETHSIAGSVENPSVDDLVMQIQDALIIRQRILSGEPEPIGLPGLNPMGVKSAEFQSTQTINITRDDIPVTDHFAYIPVLKAVPAALWGEPQMDGRHLKLPEVNPSTSLVIDTLAGFEIRPAKTPTPGTTHNIDRDKFSFERRDIQNAYQWADTDIEAPQGKDAWMLARDTIVNKDVRMTRSDLIDALGFSANGIDFGENVTEGVIVELEEIPS